MSQSALHTLASFRIRFPHADPDDGVVQSALDEAAARVNADEWATLTRAGHGYLAAHILGMDPMGREHRLGNDDEETTYGVLYEELAARVAVAISPRVI